MKVLALHTAIKVRLQKLDTASYIDIRKEVLDYYIYRATVEYIKAIVKPKQENGGITVGATAERLEEIRPFTKYGVLSASGGLIHPNSKVYALPSDYWLPLEDVISVTYSCNGTDKVARADVKVATHDKLAKLLVDPFNKPEDNNIIRSSVGNTMELIHGENATISSYTIGYIRKPKILVYDLTKWQQSLFYIGTPSLNQTNFTADTENPNYVDDEIVDRAVALIRTDISPPNYQVSLNEVLKNN